MSVPHSGLKVGLNGAIQGRSMQHTSQPALNWEPPLRRVLPHLFTNDNSTCSELATNSVFKVLINDETRYL